MAAKGKARRLRIEDLVRRMNQDDASADRSLSLIHI